LAEIGLVELDDDGYAKRPVVWYDHIEIDVRVTPEVDGSDEALA